MIAFDRDGISISLERMAELHRDRVYVRVARTKVIDMANPNRSYDVSTVWLGIDHSLGEGPPLIFETMVFLEGSSSDIDMTRYPTEALAKQGHVATVAALSADLVDAVVMDVTS